MELRYLTSTTAGRYDQRSNAPSGLQRSHARFLHARPNSDGWPCAAAEPEGSHPTDAGTAGIVQSLLLTSHLQPGQTARRSRIRGGIGSSQGPRPRWQSRRGGSPWGVRRVRHRAGHDCFATAELVHYDNLMLCDEGGAAEFFSSGATWRDGSTPVNVSGGLESKGHPIAATGIANVWEICHHLRGEAGDRQIQNAKVGLAHVIGLGSACGVHILERSAA
jgi:hypothetical protein